MDLRFAAMANEKDRRRGCRDQTVKDWNELADQHGIGTVKTRPTTVEVVDLFENLAGAVPGDEILRLKALAETWMENGGCKLDLAKLGTCSEEARNNTAVAPEWHQRITRVAPDSDATVAPQ